ncbi:uncharacterized protein LOC132799711 [Ziziphus jujuba]|uniref:Uncharacterized protein LOC132799711 n=1 Tax=Ziziphus jujuba TaxID=326968 RepID=A0ABM3ZUK2_ZIZJJ|nr:uncharacterized protein LOC132799711 [Ziziphus jujuba]
MGNFGYNKIEKKVNYVEERSQEDGTLLLAYKDKERSEDNTWYLDTGASNHMCGRRGIFVELDESVRGNVSFGEESKVAIKGKGSILIRLKSGKRHFISNVYYVLSMKSNILSLGQLLEKGYDIHLRDNHLCIRDNASNLITKVPMSRNKMFTFNIQNDASKCLKACYKDGKIWVYFLKEKSEVFENVKKFKALVEKESGLLIKSMRSDRGGEFTSNEFQKYYEDHGIRRFLTVLRSPQQNGVVERKNRTILDMVRSMLKSTRLPKEFGQRQLHMLFTYLTDLQQEVCGEKHLKKLGVEGSKVFHT